MTAISTYKRETHLETSLNLPLSGTEVRKAVVDWLTETLTEALSRDDRLAPHNAFRAMSFKAYVDISLPGAVYDRIEREFASTVGELGCDTTIIRVEAEMPELPVDEVRVETGQPVTVAATASDGRMIERQVSYAKPKRWNAKAAKSAEAKA